MSFLKEPNPDISSYIIVVSVSFVSLGDMLLFSVSRCSNIGCSLNALFLFPSLNRLFDISCNLNLDPTPIASLPRHQNG